MSPPTSFEKAENEREGHKLTLACLEAQITAHSTTPLTGSNSGVFLEQAKTLLAEHKEVQHKLSTYKPTATDITPIQAEYSTMWTRIMSVVCKLEAIRAAAVRMERTTSDSASASASASAARHTRGAEIRLPKLELPTFKGDLHEWMAFQDLFKATIHNNNRLSDVERLSYLKSSLDGDAAKLVKAMHITEANYEIAWKALVDRYDNTRELVFAILKRFFNQQTIQGESASSLRTLVDTSNECIRALETLQVPVEQPLSIVFVYAILQKVDGESRKAWELTLKDGTLPVLKEVLDYLETRARALESAAPSSKPRQTKERERDGRKAQVHHADKQGSCKLCPNSSSFHYLSRCPVFLAMSVQERRDTVKKLGHCYNCFDTSHKLDACPSEFTCRTCKKKHHTLIHQSTQKPAAQPTQTPTVYSGHTQRDQNSTIGQSMLATALVRIMDKHGDHQLCRVFLDCGSTTSFITEECVKRLGLPRRKSAFNVTGLASTEVGKSKGELDIKFQSYFFVPGDEVFEVGALILPNITSRQPSSVLDISGWSHLEGLQLADPHYYKPSKIDILLGSDVFWDLLLDGKKTGPANSPTGRASKLGWLIAGTIPIKSSSILGCHVEVKLDDQLQRFWELESVPTKRVLTCEEEKCENQFRATVQRSVEGRYTVSLPFKTPRPSIGASRDMAIRRLKGLERRLGRLPIQQEQYRSFMREYLTLGHMEAVPPGEISSSPSYYIPHHFVLKDDSTTTKLRVVFDASAKSSSGLSLNDALLVGPTTQDNLADILMRFRTHHIVFTADIAKMYRQISVNSNDTDWQRILWRDQPSDEIRDYRLTTVTYGTASAPFQATRALKQLALDEASSLPIAAAIAERDFYVDDLMSGESTLGKAIEAQTQLLEMTRRGQMELRKWTSNHPALISSLPEDLRGTQLPLSFDDDDTVKTLGLHWNPGLDSFTFKVNFAKDSKREERDIGTSTTNSTCSKGSKTGTPRSSSSSRGPESRNSSTTKRQLLSEMSKVFDPLGWLAPVTIRAKILFQQLWKTETDWDDPLPDSIQEVWEKYRAELPEIEKLSIPRCLVPVNHSDLALHGFCDASEAAYSACVYVRAQTSDGNSVISLVAAKTRVAPSKQVSLPRLELCGALLLANLMKNVQAALKLNFQRIHAWSDSTVVLAWLRGHPSRWKTFVANRVVQILEESEAVWGHVSGVDNPADCASRGIYPVDLLNHALWWDGPPWLRQFNPPPPPEMTSEEDPEVQVEQKAVSVAVGFINLDTSIPSRCSSLTSLNRVTAWCLRFVNNTQPKKLKRSGQLTVTELDEAMMLWIRFTQTEAFEEDVRSLEKKLPLPHRSHIQSLNPFLDASRLLRVGGRLRHAPISTDQKHPLLLPRSLPLTRLIILNEHLRTFHGGSQLVMTNLQKRFWILGAKDAIRHVIRKCVVCTRLRAAEANQMMADLPVSRVTPTRPFLVCGVDYAGPFLIRPITPRSKTILKAYLALFVCFSTRAIHLEVVSSLETCSFLAALKRFIARRGLCSDIHSDCGTNFVGASRELKEIYSLVHSSNHNQQVTDHLSSRGINWHFNPPGAPHFGGLWEAGVKSAKFHLHRVLGSARLTFEELTTVMTQIEACLNSRPLTPMSTDPEDLCALTPGHFLIGDSLLAIPEPDLTKLPLNRLSRWQVTQQMIQQFWKRWAGEFLTRLQQRPKWMKQQASLAVGDMVLIRDENLPPLKWRLGRISAVHPGQDGLVRVATVKTADGELKRPVVKLCRLPLDNKTEEISVPEEPQPSSSDDVPSLCLQPAEEQF